MDTTISGTYTTMNFGTNAEISVGEDASSTHTVRSLLKFDLSSIPSNATITSATLSLWTSTDSSSNTRTIRVYRLKAPFNESQATWNIAATGTNWQTAGASGTNDRESTDIGSVQIAANESIGVEKQIALTTSKIQEFVSGAFTNNGFILVADTEVDDAFAYRSSDSGTSSQRPKLVIQYTMPQGSAPKGNFHNVSYHEIEANAPRLQSGFPATSLLDNFNRSNGAIGSNWSGYTSSFSIASNQLDVTASGWSTSIFWNSSSFGADQEAYVTFTQLDSSSGDEHSLILKSQNSSSTTSGLIFVMYDATGQTVQVWTYHPSQDWVKYGSNISTTFANGDQLGARAYADGTVAVYKNGTLLDTRNVSAWPPYADGGYIGLWFASAPGALADNFGGGSVSTSPTSTPTVTPTFTATSTSTPTSAGQSSTSTSTNTSTSTSVPTPTITLTPTKTLVPTNTPPGTSTPSPTNTATAITNTATRTPTNTVTSTPTRTPTVSRTPTVVTHTSTPTPHFGSLLAHWDFNSATGTTVPDVAIGDVTENNLTLQGATLVPDGANGSAAYFDGADSATVANNGELRKNGSFTLSAWINPAPVNAQNTQTQYIIRKGGTTFDYGFSITYTTGTATPTPPANVDPNGKIIFTVGELSPNKVIGPVLPTNTWSLVTGVYDSENDQLRLYINGTLVASESVTIVGGATEITMGTAALNFSPSGNRFTGKLDDVRFYETGLTDAEVSQLITTFATPTPLPANTATPTTPATPTLTATSLPVSEQQWGTGNDGNLTVANGSTFNIHVNKSNGRTCADAVSYNVTSLGSKVATLNSSPAAGCLAAGDEVILINLRGSTTSTYNVGTYEFLRIASVSGNTVEFTTYKSKWYGSGFHSDASIGTGSGQQRVVLQRVPNYDDLAVNGTLTANEWNGSKYGILVFRVAGTLSGTSSGLISVNTMGYQGGQHEGEGIRGTVIGSTGGSEGSGYGCCSGGGGGHATAGSSGTGGAPGGAAYGNQTLSTIFFGSAGGSGGEAAGIYRGDGGHGGGILYVIGNQINYPGSLTANGQSTTTNGGGGAGGSIRVEGYDVTLGSLSATRGTSAVAGGHGRIAIYYQNNLTTGYSSSPGAYKAMLGQAPTPIPSPTSVDFSEASPYGTGKDGNLTVTGTFNLNTQYRATVRTCAEAIAYRVVELKSSWAKLSITPPAGCLAAGDEIMLINTRGTSTSTSNTGRYEFLRVGGVVQNVVYFTAPKKNYYGDELDDDTVGTGAGQQHVALQRVPNYQNVTITGTLTANTFNGSSEGMIVFRVAGTLTGSGTITVDGFGYVGGTRDSGAGEGITGKNLATGHTGGEPGNGYGSGGGGAGGYATAGQNGGGGAGGAAYGEQTLSSLYFGSGGGSSGEVGGVYRGDGGNGGGIIYIIGNDIDFSGSLSADGAIGNGGGAGGSIRIDGNDVTLGTVSVARGSSSAIPTALGARGRIAIYHVNPLTNNPTLCTQTSVYCEDLSVTPTATAITPSPTSTPFGNPGTTGLISWWSLNEASGATRVDAFGVQDLNDVNTVGSAAGKIGNAADFESSQSDFLDKGDNGSLSTGDIDFTFAAWIKLESMPSGGIPMVIAGKFDGSGAREWTMTVDASTGQAGFHVFNTDGTIGSVLASSFGSLSAGNWYYIVGWHDSFTNTVNIQVNNGAVDSSVTTGTIADSTARFRIGAQQATETRFFDGLIDEAVFYKRKLTTQQRAWLYNNGSGRAYTDLTAVPATQTATPTVNPTQPTATVTPTVTAPQWHTSVYDYDEEQPHAVDTVNRGISPIDSFNYDANGNMTCRTENGVTYKQDYNTENRISAIHKMNGNCTGASVESWYFVYDGDGTRVTTSYSTQSNPTPVITRYYFGGSIETTGSAVKKYYSFAGQTIAMKDSQGFKYFLSDHLGSTAVVLDTNGGILEQQRYLPFGAPRPVQSFAVISQTDLTYTGQRNLSGTGLMDYKARFYSPYINRFIQPDTIIPNQGDPQSWNRYSYVQNSPVNFNDPTGHMLDDGDDSGVASLGCGPAELACQVEKSERYNQYKERQRQDELVKRMFSGSGASGEWTNADQYRYFRNRDAFWDNPESWDPNGPKGWELFELHAGRLAANYMPDQKDQFVRDFALVFAGIPSLPSFALAANSVKNGPSQLPFLRYSNAGLANQYIDKREWENQSHHYAGIFALGYFAGAPTGKAVNVARDTDNPGDIALGNVAAQHGSSYWSGNNMDQIVNLISSLGP